MQIAKARKISLCFLEGEFCIDCILSSILFLAFLALWPHRQHSTTKPKSDITALNFLTFLPTLPLNCPIILTFVSAFLCLDENVEKSEHFQALIGFEINDRCWQHRKDAFLCLQGRNTKNCLPLSGVNVFNFSPTPSLYVVKEVFFWFGTWRSRILSLTVALGTESLNSMYAHCL